MAAFWQFPGTPEPRFNANNGHSYIPTRQPSPGACALAYANLGLVEFSFVGPGHVPMQFIRPFQPPVLTAGHAVPIQGLGGIVNGQLIQQPLIDPNNPLG